MRKLGGWDNWDMILIEPWPCASNLEAKSRERHWIETLGATMNTVMRPVLTREDKLADHKKYYADNHEELHRKIICECGAEITYHSKWLHAQSIKHLKAIKSETVSFACPCGSTVSHQGLPRHLKTKMHLLYLANTTNAVEAEMEVEPEYDFKYF
jgi:hypothetical protein